MNIKRLSGFFMVLILATPAAAQQTGPNPQMLEHARRILGEAPVFDGHNDLPSELLARAGADPARYDLTQRQDSTFMTDIPRLREGRVGAQFWSAYISNDSIPTGASLREALRQIDMVHRMVQQYPEHFELARTAADIERIQKAGRIASLIGVEGGHAIESSLSALRMLYELGARYMTLTHNTTLPWADAAADIDRNRGLTEFGEDVVREMNRLGMIVDLSHTAPATMRDAIRVSAAPVIFSHSSARALVDHPRNVPDDVLRSLKKNGGVVQVTFVPDFDSKVVFTWAQRVDSVMEALRNELDDETEMRRRFNEWKTANPQPNANVSDVADHIDHVRKIAGIDHVGIGSDFDGIGHGPEGLEDVSTFPTLFAELLRRGYSEADLRKISSQNMMRVLRQVEETARQR